MLTFKTAVSGYKTLHFKATLFLSHQIYELIVTVNFVMPN